MAYNNPAHEEHHPQFQHPAPIVYYAAPTITYQPTGIKNFGPHFDRNASKGFGATQIVLAITSITAGAMTMAFMAQLCETGVGVWAGVWCLTTGSIAVATGRDPKNSLIKATLVCSVFVLVFSIAQVTIAAIGVSNELVCESGSFNNNNYCTDYKVGAIVANSLLIGTGSLELIFGICLVAISAHAIKKGSKTQQFATIPVTLAPNQPEPVFMQGQPPHPHPALQSQPPPYYVQAQHPSISNSQHQIIYVGVHQPQSTNIKF